MRFLAIFALISFVEMATFFWVQSWIGLGWALALAITTALIGSALVRRAGISVMGRFRNRVDQGQVPARELSDGATVLVSGAFLISPGFITDILGFLLLIPVVRKLVYERLSKRFVGRFQTFSGGMPSRNSRVTTGRDEIIDVEGHEVG
jgi:UPF0716 protein FxsA